MADPVKGNIGEDEVVLNNAATETTLRELVQAVEKLAKGSGSGDAKEAGKQVEDLGKKSKKSGDQVEDMGDKAEDAGNAFTRGLGHTTRAALGFAEELLAGGNRISDFTSHITGLVAQIPVLGLAAGPLQLLVSVIDSNIDNFRDLTEVGTDFGGSLFNAQLQATRAGLTLETFTDTVRNNSEALALFRGGSTAGARAFTQISGILQRDFGPTASALGMQMHETAQFTADYLELQTRLGRAQRMDNFQLSQGAQTFILQLDQLSKLTGKRRDQVAAELKEFADDKRLKAILAGMDPAVKAQIDGTLSLLKGAQPELQNIVTELIGTVGIPISEQGKALALINPNLRTMAKGLVDGTVTQGQYAEEVRKTARRISNSSEAQRVFRSRLVALGVPIAEVETMLIGLDNVGKDLTGVQKQQLDAAQRGNQGLLDFERRITQVRNTILGTLIESGVFQQFEGMLNDVVDFFTGPDGLDLLKQGVNVVADLFRDVVNDIKAYGLVDTIKMYVEDAFSGLGKMIKNFIFGGEKIDNTQKIKDTEARKSDLVSERFFLSEQIADNDFLDTSELEAAQKRIAEIDSAIEKLNNRTTELSKTNNKESEGLLGGMFDQMNLANIREFVTLMGEGGSVILGMTAFAAIIGMFAAGPTAIGVGLITGLVAGIAYSGKIAAEAIDLAGAGLERVGKALEFMAQIRGADNLKNITDALGDIGPALLTLTGSNALDALAEFIGIDSPFDKIVDGVNKFAGANAKAVSNVKDVGTGLNSLSKVTKDLDTTPITKYTEAMKELVEVLDKLNKELAEENKGVFGGGTGVNAAQVIEKMNSGGGSKEELEKLNTTMMMVLQTLQTMNNTGRRQLRATEGMGTVVQ